MGGSVAAAAGGVAGVSIFNPSGTGTVAGARIFAGVTGTGTGAATGVAVAVSVMGEQPFQGADKPRVTC